PIERGIRVARAHALVQGGDEIEMLFAALVVEQDPALHGVLDRFGGQLSGGRGGGRGFQRVIALAGVAVGINGGLVEQVVGGAQVEHGQGAAKKRDDFRNGEPAQGVNTGAREQSRDDLKRRVLGGGADEDNVAALDVGQERVLLSLVEAVNLIDEKDG